MQNIIGTGVPEDRRWNWRLPCLLGGLTLAGAALAGPSEPAAGIATEERADAAHTTYRVINLGAADSVAGAAINASGQVAFSLASDRGSLVRTWFYDGISFEDIGSFGSQITRVTGLNDLGQITGISLDTSWNTRGFVWSRKGGLVNLGTLPGANRTWEPVINNHGEVAGYSTGDPLPLAHAFRWTLASGMEDLGAFTSGADSTSQARAINDTGLIAGDSMTAGYDYHAFAWTRASGMIDIDTLGSSYSTPVAVGAQGQVAGNFFFNGGHTGVFMWTPRRGMRDLGAASGDQAWMVAMSTGGRVTGVILREGDFQKAMTWTQESGMANLGTLGGDSSAAFAANNKGLVVGGATTRNNEYHAFVWTAKKGMIDLNQRLRNAPAGLVLLSARAISDNGSIVVDSNAGLVLLTPEHGHGRAPAVGPIMAAGLVKVGAAIDASVSFAGEDRAAQHNVIWSWGDGSGERAGSASARNGAGSAGGSHTYTTPGIYTVTAKVSDLAGNSAAVSRKIIVYEQSGGFTGGAGSFMSPHLPGIRAPFQAGMATFSFIAPSMAGAKAIIATGQLHFNLGALSFRSKELRALGTPGQFAGSGTINGTGSYQFSMAATAGAAAGPGAPGSFGLKIWHNDPVTGVAVVDYDNRRAGGRRIVEGMIVGH